MKRRGFTLTELAVVIVILLILAGIFYPVINAFRESRDRFHEATKNTKQPIVLSYHSIANIDYDNHKFIVVEGLEAINLIHHPDCQCKSFMKLEKE